MPASGRAVEPACQIKLSYFHKKIMRRPFLLISLLLIALSVFSQPISTKGWLSFTDSAGMFTALYPGTWKNKIKEENRVFFTSPAENEADQFNENINISVKINPSFGTSVKIKEMFPAVTEQLKTAFRDFKSESQRNFIWNKVDAVEIVYSAFSGQDDSIRIRIIQWFCFYKTRLYTVTYTAEATHTVYQKTAMAIMGSILFK